MNTLKHITTWEARRHSMIILLLRVMLGIVITFKGIIFLTNLNYLDTLLRLSTLRISESFWVYYIAVSSLVSGIFIITGLFTRLATLMQIPVLIGAVLFINPGEGVFSINGEFLLSLFVLCLLFYFFIKGAGEISMEHYLKDHEL